MQAHLQAQREAAARAAGAADQTRRLADERAAFAAKLRAGEVATGEAAARVAELTVQERDAQARLAARARAFEPLLPLIERLSAYPAETLLAVPLPPEQALRGVLVLGGLARQIEDEAAGLRREEAALRVLRAQIQVALPKFAAAQEAQARQAAALDAQIAAARALHAAAQDAAADQARQAAGEAARADGLRAALAKLDAEHQAAEAEARRAAAAAERTRRPVEAADARQRQEALARPAGPGLAGSVTAPVAGTVTHGFGEASDGGPASGVSYQSPPAARVVSPCNGRLVFSGPFRSYGQLLIVDCGGGYHFVLSGLQRLDATAGHPVQAGEPLGVMPNWDPRGGGARPTLYVELRQNGQAINPAPFLRAKG